MSEPRSKAFSMIFKRLGGVFARSSNISVTPPVKSSMASDVLPPFSASYDPFSLQAQRTNQSCERSVTPLNYTKINQYDSIILTKAYKK